MGRSGREDVVGSAPATLLHPALLPESPHASPRAAAVFIPFLNRKSREGEPQTVSIIRQGEADKISFDLEMELIRLILTKSVITNHLFALTGLPGCAQLFRQSIE